MKESARGDCLGGVVCRHRLVRWSRRDNFYKRSRDLLLLFTSSPAANLARMVSYPWIARANGIEGKVVVDVLINEKGKVEQMRIVSSDSTLFDEAALKVIHQVLFIPAVRNGIPAAAWVTVPVGFSPGR